MAALVTCVGVVIAAICVYLGINTGAHIIFGVGFIVMAASVLYAVNSARGVAATTDHHH